MLLNHVLLSFLWIMYCVLHSVLASLSLKRWVQARWPRSFHYYRLFYTLFAAVSLGAIVLFQVNIASERVIKPNLFLLITGSVVGASGILLMLVCIKKYFLSLSGLKSLYQEAPSAELMIAGIHRYMRHPLYTGTFMAIWGAWLLFPTYSLMLTNIVITAYTLYAIRLEEIKLVAEFGEQYRAYQKTVPPLVPKLKLAGIFPANGR